MRLRHPAAEEGKKIAVVIGGGFAGLNAAKQLTRSAEVAVVRRFEISGRLAWIAWLFVHVFFLIGFKNRLAVMFTWAWSYLRAKRGARLIPEPEWRLRPELRDHKTRTANPHAANPNKKETLDKIEQASRESFPASDSPGWGP